MMFEDLPLCLVCEQTRHVPELPHCAGLQRPLCVHVAGSKTQEAVARLGRGDTHDRRAGACEPQAPSLPGPTCVGRLRPREGCMDLETDLGSIDVDGLFLTQGCYQWREGVGPQEPIFVATQGGESVQCLAALRLAGEAAGPYPPLTPATNWPVSPPSVSRFEQLNLRQTRTTLL